MMFEGGSDIFTSNRHALHNNEAKSFNMMTFRTQDDAPFFTPRPQAAYVSATVPSGREECHRVTSLMLRSNFQVNTASASHPLTQHFSGSSMQQLSQSPGPRWREELTMSKREKSFRSKFSHHQSVSSVRCMKSI